MTMTATQTLPQPIGTRDALGRLHNASWFEVNREGLGQIIRDRNRLPVELLSNALDEDGVTTVDIILASVTGGDDKNRTYLAVTDDSPTGFADLADAFTLFKPSYKKSDASKRGRFNLGEKTVLALCDWAVIRTTTGTVEFWPEGRTETAEKRLVGSMFEAVIELDAKERKAAIKRIERCLIPEGFSVTLNGVPLAPRIPLRTFSGTLPTEIAGPDGSLRRTTRKTLVSVYHKPADAKRGVICELGIPVCELENAPWDLSVEQKVPLNFERDNLPDAFRRDLYALLLTNTADLLDVETANSSWVKEGLPNASPEALAAVIKQRFGDKVVTPDPSDPEAMKCAVAAGYTIIAPNSFPAGTLKRATELGIVKPAGQVTPSNAYVELSARGRPPLDRSEWSAGMANVAEYSALIGERLLGHPVTVEMARARDVNALAWYGQDTLTYNVSKLGRRWFDKPDFEAVTALLLHEVAHGFPNCDDHLGHAYHEVAFGLGARLAILALSEPTLFQAFRAACG